MALTECSECGKTISDKAESCPNCGNPIAVSYRMKAEGNEEQVLSDNHPALFRGMPVYMLGLLLALVGSILVVAGILDGKFGDTTVVTAKTVAGIILFFMPFEFLRLLIHNKAIRFTVTNRRSKLRRGLIRKNVVEVRHSDVRFVSVNQGILQRILGTGDIAVGSSGHSGVEIKIEGIVKPEKVAEMIRERQ